jgi:hypothetical protein
MPTKKILLVEGPDDMHVLLHVCGTREVGKLDEVVPQNSVEKLLENFPIRLKESDIEVLGVVIDADTDIAARWQALRDRLVKAGYQDIPQSPDSNGTVIEPPPGISLLPRFGVWIMPDNKTPGILEDFIQFLIPTDSQLFEHVKSSVANIPENERRFSPLAKPKAIVHTWLAWQEEPGKPLGTAITAKFLDSQVAQVDILTTWLKRLYFP